MRVACKGGFGSPGLVLVVTKFKPPGTKTRRGHESCEMDFRGELELVSSPRIVLVSATIATVRLDGFQIRCLAAASVGDQT